MGYKKGRRFGTDDGLSWSNKYWIARYHKDCGMGRFGKGCVILRGSSIIERKKGTVVCRSGCIGAGKRNELRKISFDIEKRDIIIEARGLNKKRFRKAIMSNVTNRDFFNYVRSHVEKLFGYLYEVTPNKDRTVFKLVKRNLE